MMNPKNRSATRSRGVSRRSVLGMSSCGALAFGLALTQRAGSVLAGPGDETDSVAGLSSDLRSPPSQVKQLTPVRPELRVTTVRAIAADPRGQLIAVACDDHAIRIMTTDTLTVKQTLAGHSDIIQTLEFDHRGNRLVSAGNDGRLMLWNRNADFKVIQSFTGTPALACVRFAPDGQEMAAVGFQNDVFLIGRSRTDSRPKVECECTDLRAVDYSDDGRMIAVAGRNGHVHLFSRPGDELLGAFMVHTGRIHSIRFLPDNSKLISVGEDGNVAIFDTRLQQVLSRWKISRGTLFDVCILDSTHLAAGGSDNQIRVFNYRRGEVVQTLRGHSGSVTALAAAGDQLFSGSFDATLRRWQLGDLLDSSDRIAGRNTPTDR